MIKVPGSFTVRLYQPRYSNVMPMRARLWCSFAVASFALILTGVCKRGAEPAQPAATISFEQLSFVTGDGEVLIRNSEWALAVINAALSADDRYVNVSVNNEWVIENMILPASASAEDSVAIAYPFGLGTARGDSVAAVDYGFALSAEPLDAAPERSAQGLVSQTRVTATCRGDGPGEVPPGTRARGGKMVPGSKARHNAPKTIPNQEAGLNECAPTAASNSLQWLNTRYDLNLPAADISIEALKTAVDWKAEGAPADWAQKKDAYVKAKGWAITTRYTDSVELARDGIRDGCDVELDLRFHVAVIVGMFQYEDGTWQIELREDLEQNARRRRAEPHLNGKYDPATKAFTGAHNMPVDGFVIECKS